jgi:quercetin dioxygenase-like cupin family protein
MDSLKMYALQKQEGQSVWFFNSKTFIKATAAQTGGGFGLIEQICPAGTESPYHMHHNEDETFYIIDGQATFISGDTVIKATSGSFVFLPRNIPHGFRIDAPTRLLILVTPGGFEGFPIEMGDPIEDNVEPVFGPPDMEKLMPLAAKYKIDIMGPLTQIGNTLIDSKDHLLAV